MEQANSDCSQQERKLSCYNIFKKEKKLMSAYIIYHYNIIDRDRIDELGPLADPVVKKYNGEISDADNIIRLEGSPYSHMVAYKFESQRVALDFYKEEQEVNSKTRNQVIDGTVTMVPAFGSKHEFGDT